MKLLILNLFLGIILLVACDSSQKQVKKDFITFQMDAEQSEKMLDLNQIATVEYVKLGGEKQDFLVNSAPMACTDQHIVVYEYLTGDFFVFDSTGKPLTRFNHKGDGPGEYTLVTGIVCDEFAGELFVYFMDKIEVYGLDGFYRRTLNLSEGVQVAELFDFGSDWLLAYDASAKYKEATDLLPGNSIQNSDAVQSLSSVSSPFRLFSKDDGHVERFFSVAQNNDIKLVATMAMDGMSLSFPARTMRIVPLQKGAILYNQESDTLFYLSRNLDLQPVAVRKPSVDTTNPMRYLNGYLETRDYFFFESVPMVVERGRFTPIYLCRDKRDGSTFRPVVYLPDFANKEIFLSSALNRMSSDSQVGYLLLSTEELLTALEEDRLSGRLKKLALTLNEEDNYILARLRFFSE